jgi:hypothetical protein
VACIAFALLGLGVIAMLEGGLSTDLITRYLLSLGGFTVLSAAFWALFMSQRGRRFFFRHGSAIPSGLEFDEQAVTWLIGKQRLFYRWSQVRSIG